MTFWAWRPNWFMRRWVPMQQKTNKSSTEFRRNKYSVCFFIQRKQQHFKWFVIVVIACNRSVSGSVPLLRVSRLRFHTSNLCRLLCTFHKQQTDLLCSAKCPALSQTWRSGSSPGNCSVKKVVSHLDPDSSIYSVNILTQVQYMTFAMKYHLYTAGKKDCK